LKIVVTSAFSFVAIPIFMAHPHLGRVKHHIITSMNDSIQNPTEKMNIVLVCDDTGGVFGTAMIIPGHDVEVLCTL